MRTDEALRYAQSKDLDLVEVTPPERGVAILDRLAEELAELASIEQRPNLEGRNMTMLLGPSKAILAGTLEEAVNGEAPAAEGVVTAENGAEAPPAAPEPES